MCVFSRVSYVVSLVIGSLALAGDLDLEVDLLFRLPRAKAGLIFFAGVRLCLSSGSSCASEGSSTDSSLGWVNTDSGVGSCVGPSCSLGASQYCPSISLGSVIGSGIGSGDGSRLGGSVWSSIEIVIRG